MSDNDDYPDDDTELPLGESEDLLKPTGVPNNFNGPSALTSENYGGLYHSNYLGPGCRRIGKPDPRFY